ncbi:MAG: hypothetical protein H0T46_26745 [Deltaproteobacteria bacterium]|nr:hypothetical protein [Deltaproteobacteria bacterium]
MAKPATRDEILDQIRTMPTEDREYIEAELMREAYEAGRMTEAGPLVAELVRRAEDALAHPERGVSREQAVANARAAVDRVRARIKP